MNCSEKDDVLLFDTLKGMPHKCRQDSMRSNSACSCSSGQPDSAGRCTR